MPFDSINIGAAPGDGQGEGLREAMVKVNTMLAELYALVGALGLSIEDPAIVIAPKFYVTLQYDIFPPTVNIDGLFELELGMLPADFILHDLTLTTIKRDTSPESSVDMNAALIQGFPGVDAIVADVTQDMPADGRLNIPVTSPGGLLLASSLLRLSVNVAHANPGYEDAMQGLRLFLRGNWYLIDPIP